MSTSFSPTPAELALVNQIFAQGDPQKLGVLTGEVAVRIFGGAKLPPAVLGEVWNIADEDNKGWLSKKGVAVAVRLMGWAQKGEKVTSALLNKPGPLPAIEGVSAITQHNTGMSTMSSPKSPALGFPPLTPADKAKFHNMFYKSGPINGLLSGEKARDIFLKSKLPTDKLMQIWTLADTHDRGALDATDFAIGMYFIQHVMSGHISFIPSSLPPGLYQQAGGVAPQATGSVATHMTGGGSGFPAQPSPLPQQYTGHRQPLQPNMTGNRVVSTPNLPARPAAAAFGSQAFGTSQPAWDVTPVEKANSDKFFDGLDTAKLGYIEGDVAVPFMLQSNLPEDDLARVWDLADINNDGRLSKDGFAIAMHLIQKKLAGGDIPATLPPSLIPPSMRGQTATAQSPFMQATPSQPPPAQEPMRDLFNFDDEPPATMSPPLAPQATGGNTLSAQPTGTAAALRSVSTPVPAFVSPAASQDPFGASAAASPSKNLLDDDEEIQDEKARQIQNQSVEIRNVQNQVESTTRSLDNSKNERANLETTLAEQAAQLSALQTQLSSAKAAFDTEQKLLSTLKERHINQTSEIHKAREELIRAESDLSALKVEKSEIEGAFLRDKEEARGLHRKMTEVGHEIEIIKAEIEKAKKEAKQQKGLLAIAKKQLGTKETERAKTEKELDEAAAEVASITREKDETEAQLAGSEALTNGTPLAPPAPERATSNDSVTFAAAQPLPISPSPGSPAPSVKSNNPFERLAMSPGSRSQSPFAVPSAIASPPLAAASTSPLPEGAAPAPAAEQPAAAGAASDPFGFSAAFELPAASEAQEIETTEPTGDAAQSTPKPVPADIIVPPQTRLTVDNPGSPTTATESEFFTTPPSTARRTPETTPDKEQASATTASPEATTPQPPHTPQESKQETVPGAFPGASEQPSGEADLSAGVKELDVDESDSSDDEDEVPLATLAKKADEARASLDGPSAVNGHAPSGPTGGPSFDDIFGGEAAPAEAAKPAAAGLDAFGMPIQQTASPFEAPADNLFASSPPSSVSQDTSGVSAFDEAMGKVQSSGASPAPQFSFDSAFDDNFDFASAKATDNNPFPTPTPPAAQPSTFPPVGSSSFPAVGSPAPATDASKASNEFDAIFGAGEATSVVTPRPPKASALRPASSFMPDGGSPSEGSPAQRPMTSFFPSASPHAANGTGEAPKSQPSFDEAFGGFDSGPSLKLDDHAAESPARASAETANSPKTFPTEPASPKGSEMSMRGRRAVSPPPRVGSPRSTGRPSTSSSSKDGHDGKPQPATRHSKLSIRLPFGKKKKHTAPPEPMPAPPSHLSPAIEEPRNVTPGSEDDVEPVKQLTSMGFSRSQAVSALEAHGYDVQRALNSLLGQ